MQPLAAAQTSIRLPYDFTPRPYQVAPLRALDEGTKRAVLVWPRRAGKDITFANHTAKCAFQRVGLYLHLLPTAKQARRVVWDNITSDGKRLIDVVFPKQLREDTNEAEMKIRFTNGSVWQLVGADYFDSIVGSNPVGLVVSEAAITDPQAWNYLRPILAANGGWAVFISTPRGFNWFHRLLETAKSSCAAERANAAVLPAAPAWYHSHLTCDDTRHISAAALAQERAEMPDELFRQEFYCDFSAANVGAILGRYMEQAEKDGRINDDVVQVPHARIIISSDIGYRDKAAFWWWQVRRGGFDLIDYDEGSGMDAEEWIPRLRLKPRADTIYLPHDARVKTFQSRHSVFSQFLAAGLADEVKCSPVAKKADSINAARTVLKRCAFNRTKCAPGLVALRGWSFKYNEDSRSFSAEPQHDDCSHGADALAEGAKVLQLELPAAPSPPAAADAPTAPMHAFGTLDDLWGRADNAKCSRQRI